MSQRDRRTTVPGRKPRKAKIARAEEPLAVLECERCSEPAVEIFAPLACRAMENAHVLCADCNEGDVLVVCWHFLVPATSHPILDSAEARVRIVGKGRLDLSCSRMTFLP